MVYWHSGPAGVPPWPVSMLPGTLGMAVVSVYKP